MIIPSTMEYFAPRPVSASTATAAKNLHLQKLIIKETPHRESKLSV